MPDVIIDLLLPHTIGDFFIYALFFLALLTMAIIPEKNPHPTTLLSLVLVLCIIDKLRTSTSSFPVAGFDDLGFGTMLLHIGMMVFSYIAAGLVRQRGRKGAAAVPLAILMGLIGTLYTAAAFFSPGMVYSQIL